MRSKKSHRDVVESAESEEESASEESEASSDEEVAKKAKKRSRKHSSSSDSDTDESRHRKGKKKKHKKKKSKHAKKKRHQSSDDEESDTNEDLSSEPEEESTTKKKKKHKRSKSKHSKKKSSKSASEKGYVISDDSRGEVYSKQHVSRSGDEISLSSEDSRHERRKAAMEVHKSVSSRHSKNRSERDDRYRDRSGHDRAPETNDRDRFYGASEGNRPRREDAGHSNVRPDHRDRPREAPPHDDRRDRFPRNQQRRERTERVDPQPLMKMDRHPSDRGEGRAFSTDRKYREFEEQQRLHRQREPESNPRYEDKRDYERHQNVDPRYKERFHAPERFPENTQISRYEEERYRQTQEEHYRRVEQINREIESIDHREGRYPEKSRAKDYHHQPQKRNIEIKSLPPINRYRNDIHDDKPGASGHDNRHFRNNQPIRERERINLPPKRQDSHRNDLNSRGNRNNKNGRPFERPREDDHNNSRRNRFNKDNKNADHRDTRVDHNNKDRRNDKYKDNRRNDLPKDHKEDDYAKDNKQFDKYDRHSERYEKKNEEKDGDRGGFKERRPAARKNRKENADESASYDWGKKTETEVKEEKADKEKPNFGLSGKLTEDTNLVHGVVLKYSPPDDSFQPKRKWRFYPFKGEQALPILYIHRQQYFLLGRDRKVADIALDHPSISKQHAVLQYRMVKFTREDGSIGRKIRPYIIDLESANGTFVNNKKIEPRKFLELMERDVVKFGFSQREYVLLNENSKDDDDDVKATADPEESNVTVKSESKDN